MAIIAADLGDTKLATVLFDQGGSLRHKAVVPLGESDGPEVGDQIRRECSRLLHTASREGQRVHAIGICVPGIYQPETGTVWAPNIPGWESYPLLRELSDISGGEIPVSIEGDRSCCILGEAWRGAAKGCRNAVFLTVGTGIGAGVLVDGRVLRGARDIAGAVGWLAMDRPFDSRYAPVGCLEYRASGDGIARMAAERIAADTGYEGVLPRSDIRVRDVFQAFDSGDPIACSVLSDCIELWGMAAADLVSILNPEVIIFGGGVFGPAVRFLDDIRNEAENWAQPIAFKDVRFEISALGDEAALYGAAFSASRIHSLDYAGKDRSGDIHQVVDFGFWGASQQF